MGGTNDFKTTLGYECKQRKHSRVNLHLCTFKGNETRATVRVEKKLQFHERFVTSRIGLGCFVTTAFVDHNPRREYHDAAATVL